MQVVNTYMLPIQGDFGEVKTFDHAVMGQLADYFDLDYVANDLDQMVLWLDNLSVLAGQNLGLAHCVVHNQTARSCADLAYRKTGLPQFDRPIRSQIGAYSFFKGGNNHKHKHYLDSMRLDGNRLRGVKRWCSQLSSADYVVLKVEVEPKQVLNVFVDLRQVTHEIKPSEFEPIGMQIAKPFDLHIDSEIPVEWVMSPMYDYVLPNKLHFLGMITNYIACSDRLLRQASELGFGVDYEIKKLQLDLDIAHMLKQSSLPTLLDADINKSFKVINPQYQFARKSLIRTISFFLEVMSTGLCDAQSERSQCFRDALTMGSHVVSLYRHIDGAIGNFT